MLELPAGANAPLAPGTVRVRLPGPFDLSALVLGADGRVGGDPDFVFYNQPVTAGVRLAPAPPASSARELMATGDEVTVEPGQLRAGAARVVLVASPSDGRTAFGRLPVPRTTVHDAAGTEHHLVPPRLDPQTAILVGEIYRRSGDAGWRVRSVGQGYDDGLAGLARDFGVVVDEPGTTPAATPPHGAGPRRGAVAAAGVMPPGVPPPLRAPTPEEIMPAHEGEHLSGQGSARGSSESTAPPNPRRPMCRCPWVPGLRRASGHTQGRGSRSRPGEATRWPRWSC
jgi:stress response protein SCP2